VQQLAKTWRKYGHDLGFGMGIAYGYATLGRISSEGRFDHHLPPPSERVIERH
jgi:class 3 adenylate cyclase